VGGGPVEFEIEPPKDAIQSIGDDVAQLLFPALLTISFMHCKNVFIRSKEPPKKLSNKYRKKSGRDLISYHVLDIEPIRKIFKQFKTGQKAELRRALHLCRAHFKTFTEERSSIWKTYRHLLVGTTNSRL